MKELVPLLDALAKKLGTTADYLWAILVRQAPISAIIDLVQYALLVIGCIATWKLTKFIHRKVENDNWDDMVYLPLGGLIIVCFILIITVFFCIHSTLTGFINPEYWALEKVLNVIKPDK